MIVLSCGRFSASVDELQLSSERTQVWVPHRIRATQRLSGNSDKTDVGTSQDSSYTTLVSGVGTSQESRCLSVAPNFGSSSIALSLTNTEEPVTCPCRQIETYGEGVLQPESRRHMGSRAR